MSVRARNAIHWGRVGGIALLAAISVSTAGLAESPARRPLVLLNDADAAKLQMDGEWPPRLSLRSVSTGPRIIIQRPEVQDPAGDPTVRLTSPGALLVRFEPTAAPVDMNTLEVTARKSFFSKSLTGLLRPYVRGTTIQVEELEIPSGKFLIEVAIADAKGAQTTTSYRFEVSEK